MLGRDVRQAIVSHGPGFALANLESLLAQADLRFANLECVLPAPGEPVLESPFDMWSSWEGALGLVRARLDVLSLANNHILDHGANAARSTAAFCHQHGLLPIGFGETAEEARRARIVERNGLRLAFLGYTDAYGPHGFQGQPGPAYAEAEVMLADVHDARQHADAVIVSLHADLEFAHHPAPWRLSLCRKLVDAGATLILGHHPHVPQGVERRGHGLIAYSLGNLVYDATTRASMRAGGPFTAQSVVLDVDVEAGRVVEYRLHPFCIGEDHRPQLLAAADRDELLRAIEGWSIDLQDPQKIMEAWVDTCLRYVGVTLGVLSRAFAEGGAETVIQSELPMLVYGPLRPFADHIVAIVQELARPNKP